MIYILILAAFGSYGGGPATAEFNTESACIEAGERSKNTFTPRGAPYIFYICVPKGEATP